MDINNSLKEEEKEEEEEVRVGEVRGIYMSIVLNFWACKGT